MSTAVAEQQSLSVQDAEWVARLRAAERAARRAQATVLELLADPQAGEVAARSGYGSLPRFLAATLLVSACEARTRVALAEALGTRRALTGERLPPRCPVTAAAVATGEISLAAARTVVETVERIPPSVSQEEAAQAEATLAGYAAQFEPRALAALGRRVLAHLDPDGAAPTSEPPAGPPRALYLRPDRLGRTRLDGYLDPEGAAVLRTVLDALNPRRPTDASGPDTRTLAQRNADALVEACTRLLDDAVLPTRGGQRPHLVLTLGLDQLRADLAGATLDYAGPVDAATARRLACDAAVTPVVLGGDSQPLDVGHARRTATTAMRAALAARDGGCAFPGCDTPPPRCTAHHITGWAHTHYTALSNLVLLCRWHHHLVHHSAWQVRLSDHRPEFIPPEYLDPERKPLCNPLRQ